MSNELRSEVFRDFTTRPPKNHLRVSYRVEPRQLREPYKNSKKNICNLCIYFLTHLQHCDGNTKMNWREYTKHKTNWREYKNELAGIHKTQDELAGILSMGLEPMASSLLDSRSNQLS